jgi:hypothetical protein
MQMERDVTTGYQPLCCGRNRTFLLVKLFYKPLQGLRGCGAEPHIRKGLMPMVALMTTGYRRSGCGQRVKKNL